MSGPPTPIDQAATRARRGWRIRRLVRNFRRVRKLKDLAPCAVSVPFTGTQAAGSV